MSDERLTLVQAIVDDIMHNILECENLSIIRDALTQYYREDR
jgi:hypothetical protein